MKNKKLDFINLRYKPTSNDLICLFKITPKSQQKNSLKQSANTVALESSVGTWTPVSSKKKYVNKLAAKVFSINSKSKKVKISYPQQLFEKNNIANLLSSIAGNVFGMKTVKSLRLEDVSFPSKLLKSFPGPQYGIKGIRKILKVKSRPLVGTIIKPKLGLKTIDHAKVAYESWLGGCDLVKDDENLASQNFNKFESRLYKTLEAKDKAEKQTAEKKAYLINVTAETKQMLKRADLVKKAGGKFVMLDILTTGFSALQTLRQNTKLAIHAHRAMHGSFTENPQHGISMMVIADLARLAGVDSLHIGTAIGKMKGALDEVKDIREEIEDKKVKATAFRLKQNWQNIKSVFAVCSGGIYPGHVPYLIKHFGKDIFIQAGGGIHGHPQGTRAGAKAMRQAVDKYLGKKQKNQKFEELEQAMKFWGKVKF